MSIERKGGTTFKGNALTLVGEAVKVGQKAPDFKAVAGDLSEVTLSSSAGKNPPDHRGPFSRHPGV
jgi:peroxiredoxin